MTTQLTRTVYNDTMRSLATHMKKLARQEGSNLTREQLITLGSQYWDFSYRHTDDDYDAFSRAVDTAAHMTTSTGQPMSLVLASPGDQISVMNAALWYHQGLNQIVLGHKMAAALLATKVNKDAVKDIQPPWRAFYISLPDKMFFIKGNDGKDVPVYGVIVARMKYPLSESNRSPWQYVAITNTSLTLWRHGFTTEMLVDDRGFEGLENDNPFSEEISDLDERANSMLGHLIVNVCLAMNDPSNIKSQPKEEWRGWSAAKSSRKNKLPSCRTYILSREGILDCREAVTEYLRTGKQRKGLTVQTLVSGHFRNQAHGPQHSLRKVIWVEPFWRGPEDAPILSRSLRSE